MIEVSSLTIYPLKGGRGIRLSEMPIDQLGPRNDRRWMVVDHAGRFITQREVGRLCQVVARPTDRGLALSAPHAPSIAIERPSDSEARGRVAVWKDTVDAIDAGDSAARWLTEFLTQPARLVYLPDSADRRTDPAYDPERSPVGFADGYPILLLGEESLLELNGRLATPLPMNRFRPNIVVRGGGAFAEDSWTQFEIGGIRFEGVKPCARCVVTTTDQDTGERGPEPLRALAGFRKRGVGVMFGMNVVHRGTGMVRVGDPVTVRLPNDRSGPAGSASAG